MLKNIVRFYVQGFANMTLGKTLWKIIVIKLLVIFIVLKFFIYGDSIRDIGGAKERSEYVLDNLSPLESAKNTKVDSSKQAHLSSLRDQAEAIHKNNAQETQIGIALEKTKTLESTFAHKGTSTPTSQEQRSSNGAY